MLSASLNKTFLSLSLSLSLSCYLLEEITIVREGIRIISVVYLSVIILEIFHVNMVKAVIRSSDHLVDLK